MFERPFHELPNHNNIPNQKGSPKPEKPPFEVAFLADNQ
jgi:hypothetical protein